ncbi:MAG: HEPN domain-containing protein, partial [Cyclobacteriaceae bacterium]
PALQLLLGGGFDSEGKPSIADKVVKLPSKRVPAAFTKILEDYEENGFEGEYFNNYYRRQIEADKMYFFQLMKPYTDTTDIPDSYYVDWGEDEKYVKAVGVGECAGVILDLVGTLLLEAEEKFTSGQTALERGYWQDSIYFSYKTMVLGAKALLIGEGIQCNTHDAIIADFDEHYVQKGLVSFGGKSFADFATQLNANDPSIEFAEKYLKDAEQFIQNLKDLRGKQVSKEAVS